ncbi:MAG: DUF1080 domain-containing protein [Armatimonadetes bacterium]|nr:DUF1080 domain-containing protein [Armatimonadota bacterium]
MSLLTPAVLALVAFAPSAFGPWIDLFDGKSFSGWTNVAGKPVGKGWVIEDGCIRRVATGAMDIVTTRQFRDFELEVEWKLQPKTNSGIKYRLHRMPDGGVLGPEYQIMDDPVPPAASHKGSCAALYSIKEPRADIRQKTPGEWNTTRIVAVGARIEHWLNGEKVVEIDQSSPEWNERLDKSKFAEREGYRKWFARGASPILLQDHGGSIWFRNVRLREAKSGPSLPTVP